jgi:hypothetical protein
MTINNNYNNNFIKKLQLYRTENVGPVTYRHLLDHYSPEDAIYKIKEMAFHGGKTNLFIPSYKEIEQVYLKDLIEIDTIEKYLVEKTTSI